METDKERIVEKTVGKGSVATLFDAFLRPATALEKLRENPGKMWLLLAALIIASSVLMILVSVPLQQKAVTETFLEQERKMQEMTTSSLEELPPEERKRIERETRKQESKNRGEETSKDVGSGQLPESAMGIALGFALVSGLILIALGWLVKSGLAVLISQIWGSKAAFSTIFAAIGITYLPFVVKNSIQGFYMLITGKLIKHQGLSSLVVKSDDPMVAVKNPAYVLLSHVDIFTFWSLYLLFLALVICGGLSKKKSALVTIVYIGGILAVSLIPSLLSQFIIGA